MLPTMCPFEILFAIATSVGALALSQNDPHSHQQDVLAGPGSANNPPSSPMSFKYQCFHGQLSHYPAPKSWLSFSDLWNTNREQILSSNGGNAYIQHYIHESILAVSEESNVDPRLILALIMGESNGDASTPCLGPLPRCGILHAPKGSSIDGSQPEDSIKTMIREGVVGSTNRGPGYAQILQGKPRMANVSPGCAFAAARAYHSGIVREYLDYGHDAKDAGFVNDFANRLLGWNGRGEGFGKCSYKNRAYT